MDQAALLCSHLQMQTIFHSSKVNKQVEMTLFCSEYYRVVAEFIELKQAEVTEGQVIKMCVLV